MVLGDETSREMDQKLGYFLHLSFGKVTEMNSTTFRVHLNWLFLERYSSKLRSWRLPTGSLYSTELDAKEILTKISGEPLKGEAGLKESLHRGHVEGVSIIYDTKRSRNSCCVADELDIIRRTGFRAISTPRQPNFASYFSQLAVFEEKQKKDREARQQSAFVAGMNGFIEKISTSCEIFLDICNSVAVRPLRDS